MPFSFPLVCPAIPTLTLRRLFYRSAAITARAWQTLAYSPTLDRFICLTSLNGFMMRSDDGGVTWIESAIPAVDWRSVIWSPRIGKFVALGAGASAVGLVMTSPDGVNWTQFNAAVASTWRALTDTGQRFVAVSSTGGPNTVMTSANGETWSTPGTPPASRTYIDIVYAPELNRLLAVGELAVADCFATSDDHGLTWTLRTQPLAGPNYSAGAWSPQLNLFMAIQSGVNSFATSPNGITWTSRASPVAAFTSCAWAEDIARFLAFDANGAASSQMFASADGIALSALQSDVALGTGTDIIWASQRGASIAVGTNRVARSGVQFTYS